MSASNIYLIGFMGVGKSTVGKELAQIKQYSFIDIDAEVERRLAKSIPDIFRDEGESFFRQYERNIIEETKTSESLVVALGGGGFHEKILEYGTVIYLKASLELLLKRIKGTKRPLVSQATELYKKRTSLYEKATLTINTENKSIEEIVLEIHEKSQSSFV